MKNKILILISVKCLFLNKNTNRNCISNNDSFYFKKGISEK